MVNMTAGSVGIAKLRVTGWEDGGGEGASQYNRVDQRALHGFKSCRSFTPVVVGRICLVVPCKNASEQRP